MADLPVIELPAFRLAALPAVDPRVAPHVRRLWVDLTLRLESGLKSDVADITAIGVLDSQGQSQTYSLGIPVAASTVFLPEGMRELKTEPGRFVRHTIRGPYAALPAAYEMVDRLLANAGVERDGRSLEVYRAPNAAGATSTELYVGVRE
ncbi:MAG: GyrI-like domain-containing protein [Dehalococcoidia bacterium]